MMKNSRLNKMVILHLINILCTMLLLLTGIILWMISFYWADRGYVVPMVGIEAALVLMGVMFIPISIILSTYCHKKIANIFSLLMTMSSIIMITFALLSINYQDLEREIPPFLETSAIPVRWNDPRYMSLEALFDDEQWHFVYVCSDDGIKCQAFSEEISHFTIENEIVVFFYHADNQGEGLTNPFQAKLYDLDLATFPSVFLVGFGEIEPLVGTDLIQAMHDHLSKLEK